jgi:hypothetical protein
MFCADSFGAAAMTRLWRTRPGWDSVHCSACIAPSEPPMTAAKRSMPSRSARRACASTQSSTVTTGKSAPQGLPVAGLADAGPVEPKQLPR